MERPNRKPDFEDNQLRAWKMPLDEYKGDLDDENAMKFELDKNIDFQFFPETMMRNGKTKEAYFGFKFKHEEKQVLYLYIEENDDNKPIGVMKYLKPIIASMFDVGVDYEIVDIREIAEHAFNKVAKESLDKDGKTKD